ncbi:selenite/tellurite reduction operon porin ExtI [Thioalkalivibrio thiocyanodenitrificans]|uniref:selenite/tellurite reduction operon porin ExtI n=1 Tax=Thioalkalivibrio thiocyanodenitrificans TaxID=243063 RepID=UPI00035F0A59|nr:selenite/tellurite reduction operon porin ExtI [Thioalkalivibrio thiocyanodenitrificans]
MRTETLAPVFRAKRLTTALAALALAGGAAGVQAGPVIMYGDEGFLQLNYELQIWSQYRDFRSNALDGDTYDTFLRRNRITVLGQYNDYIGFYAQLEAGNESRAGQDDRSVYYRDAYVTFDWSDPVRLIAGRFKSTFSRENLEACLEPLTLDRGIPSYAMGKTRDTGIALWGNLADARWQYRLMVADGLEGDNVPKTSPRITGRIHYSAFDPEYSYGYRGTYLGTQRVLTIGAAYDFQQDAVYANLPARSDARDYSAWTVDAFYEEPTAAGTLTLSAAYYDYSVDGALEGDPLLVDNSLTPTADMTSYYVKGGWLFPNRIGIGRLQVYARHESSDYNRSDDFYDQTINAIGANYYIDGQNVKFTFEYMDVSFDEEHPTINSLKDHKQATLGFQLLF